MSADIAPRRRRLTPAGLAAAVFGLLLFAWTVRETGLGTILDGIRRVGSGFLLILLLSGLRFLARAWAWTLCTDEPHDLRVRDTFPAMVTGDALGNVTPLGLIVSEPTKAAFVRHRVSLMTALAGIAVENLLYTLTVATVIVGGTVALLFSFDVPAPLRAVSLIALGGMVVFVLLALTLFAGDVRVISRLASWIARRNLAPTGLGHRLDKVRALEARIYTFTRRHPTRVFPVLTLETAYHAAGVAEVWITLALLTGAAPGASDRGPVLQGPTLLTAFLLESLNRLINVAFKFVPLRLGVDEAGSGLLADVLGLTSATGVTLAIVRKARVLFWTGVGVLLLARRGLSPLRDAELGMRTGAE